MELLAPAGNFEKLKYAIHYGADAVYASGKHFGLRAQSANFSDEELQEATQFCHRQQKKIYVTVNIFAHNRSIDEIGSHLRFLESIQVDALIISDPGIFRLAKKYAKSIPIHISTQANVTSWSSAKFWSEQGAKRIILARELSLPEMREIKKMVPEMELEMFAHGAMCMAYSGRCLLSSYLNARDANQGDCSQPCRWDYALVERTRPTQEFPIEEDAYGTYIFNSKDLCLARQIKTIMESDINSVKIEGRMKSIYYAANVTRIYRAIIDAAKEEQPIPESWIEESNKISHRHYTEGFFHGFTTESTQTYESSAYIREYQYLGNIVSTENGLAKIEMKAKFSSGDEIEFIFPKLSDDFSMIVTEMYDEENQPITFTKPNTTISLPVSGSLPKWGIIRKKIQ
jgi:putative protease